MTDVEYILKEDQRSKKAAGRGIYGKKNGSRSKKCSLPSDHLSKKELKKMNGEIKMYNLSKPMSYSVFCSMPIDLRIEYLKSLRDTYGASLDDISRMMHTSYHALAQHKQKHLAGNPEFKNYKKSRLDGLAWARFLTQDCDKPKEEPKEGDIKFVHEYISVEEALKEEPQEFPVKGTLLSISEGRICLKGKPQNIFRTIEFILEDEGTYEVEFKFTRI